MAVKSSARSKRTPLKKEKNRIRGLIGLTKGIQLPKNVGRRKGTLGDRQVKAGDFQRSLAAALIRSRQSLATSQFDDFLRWMESQRLTQLTSLNKVGPLPTELVGEVVSAHPLPLQKEIQWVVSRLAGNISSLKQFEVKLERLERCYWDGAWPNVKRHIDAIEQEHGKSLWSFEARITFSQEFEGLENQKRIVAEARKVGSRSLIAYVAHNIGVRNEPTTDLNRFRTDFLSKLSQLSISEALKDYLKFRIGDQLPETERAAANVLKIAQSLNEIDLYDALLGICQSEIVRKIDQQNSGVVTKTIRRLEATNSRRLVSVLDWLANEPEGSVGAVENLSHGITALRELRKDPFHCDLALGVAALVSSGAVVKGAATTKRPWSSLIRRMANILKFDESFDSYILDFQKQLSNRRFLAVPARLSALVAAELQADSDRKILANIEVITPRYLSRKPRWQTVLGEIRALRDAIDSGDMARVVSGVCRLCLDEFVPLSAIPFQQALANVRWKELKKLRASIELPIALHLCWRATDSDLAATNLRYSYEEFLDCEGVENPAELGTTAERHNPRRLIYFLRDVCVPSVMDMSPRIKSSAAVGEIRMEVCAALRELDPTNASAYDGEIVTIVQSQTLLKGQDLVDSSRIHVDTTAIKAWAARVLATDLERYNALLEAGIGIGEDIDTILRNIQSKKGLQSYLEVPESEADEILIEMMSSLRQQFLLDPQHGLDSYLSRRIRHHSMTGYIRGPVEEKKLITSRNTKSGRYAENTFWINELGVQGTQRQGVSKALLQFAEDFDRIVLRLKNNLFHVRSADHPLGIFDVQLISPMIHLCRGAVQHDISMDALCAVCFAMFWGSLEPSLKEAQRQLQGEAKRDVLLVFQRLRANLRRELRDETSYAEISYAIGQASETVQREIDRMTEWFVRKEVQQTNHLYSIDKVLEISISSALASHRPFAHSITKHISCDYFLRAGDLVVVAEIILTALGNIKAYAGNGNANIQVTVNCEQADRIVFRIENDVASPPSAAAKKRVSDIREEIQNGTFIEKVREEDGTGLMKIAATAAQSKVGKIEFGFIEDTKFFVEVTLAFIREAPIDSSIAAGRIVG